MSFKQQILSMCEAGRNAKQRMLSVREAGRNAMQTVMVHHWNQATAIQRAAQAKAWELDPNQWVSPFHQGTVTNIYQGGGSDSLLKWLLALLLLGGIGTGGVLCGPSVYRWWTHRESVVEKVVPGTDWDKAVDVTVEHGGK